MEEKDFLHNPNAPVLDANDELIDMSDDFNFADYQVGVMVSHVKFGIGTIIKVENIGDNSFVSVDFGSIGVKTLSLAFAPLKILKK